MEQKPDSPEENPLVAVLFAVFGLFDSVARFIFRADEPRPWQTALVAGVLLTAILGSICYGALSVVSTIAKHTMEGCAVDRTSPRAILSSTIKLTHLWSVKVYIDSISDDSLLLATPELLLIGNYCQDLGQGSQVTAFDLRTGNKRWFNGVNTTFALTVDQGRNLIFVSSGTFGVQGLSLASGLSKIVVSSKEFERRSNPIQVLPTGQVFVYAGDGEYLGGSILILTPETGALARPTPAMPGGTFLYEGRTVYVEHYRAIEAIDYFSRQRKWLTSIDDRFYFSSRFRPHIYGDLLLVRSFGGTDYLAFDLGTGRVLWDTVDRAIISNAVVADGVAFALDSEAKLLLLNVQTGAEAGSVQFEKPKPTRLMYEPGAIGGSYVALIGTTLAIYFQDTDTLSVYSIERPS